VNNLAYSRLLRDFVAREQLPLLTQLIAALCAKVTAWRDIAFPARTHGQKASPSTLGKEMAVFADRLLRQRGELAAFRFRGKITGATGTWAAWRAAFPGHDWPAFSWLLVSAMGLEPAMVTTQVEDHDTWASYFALAGRVNGIVRDLDVDVWLYQTLGYLGERAEADEVGSSTMPHKVNPIRFENSEGNLHVADALLDMMRRELTHSRLQRDLSDSTVTRNIGVALAHSLLAWQETLAGLARLEPRHRRCEEDLRDSPELLTEPIQTILRAEGVADAYDLVRRFSRGRPLTGEELAAFVQSLPVSTEAKDRILALRVNEYTGYAGQICDRVLAACANLETELNP
jgi:adenylosuccinate lyase